MKVFGFIKMPGFTWVKFDQNFETSYTIKKEGNGVYTFVLKGDFTLGGINVNATRWIRDY
jgi:hypothetical protein